MPRAFSARKPLERSKRPHNSAVCVNFKFDQASPPSISLLLAQPASSPPSFPLLPKSCIINIYRDVSTTRSKGAFIFVFQFLLSFSLVHSISEISDYERILNVLNGTNVRHEILFFTLPARERLKII